jgi:hypothetical protein
MIHPLSHSQKFPRKSSTHISSPNKTHQNPQTLNHPRLSKTPTNTPDPCKCTIQLTKTNPRNPSKRMNFKAYYNQNQRWKTQKLKRCSSFADQKVNTRKIDKTVSKGSVWFKSMGITWMTSSARSLHLWAFGWRWSPSGIPHGLSLLGTGLVSLISLPLSDPPKESQRGTGNTFFFFWSSESFSKTTPLLDLHVFPCAVQGIECLFH